MATAASGPDEKRVEQHEPRIPLTPTGLLMEGHYTQNPTHTLLEWFPYRLKPAPQRQTIGLLPDGCSTVHPDNSVHFQLKQDSLGSTRSRAARYR